MMVADILMEIYFDLDDTLIDAKLFIEDIVSVFVKSGLEEEIVEQALYDLVPEGYTFEKHLAKLNANPSILEDLEKLFNVERYLFQDVLDSISALAEKYDLHILSFGYEAFQMKKWSYLEELHPYFKTVNIVQSIKKGEFLRDNGNSGDIFIDDKLYELHNVNKEAPFIKTFQIIRHPRVQTPEHANVIWSLNDLVKEI